MQQGHLNWQDSSFQLLIWVTRHLCLIDFIDCSTKFHSLILELQSLHSFSLPGLAFASKKLILLCEAFLNAQFKPTPFHSIGFQTQEIPIITNHLFAWVIFTSHLIPSQAVFSAKILSHCNLFQVLTWSSWSLVHTICFMMKVLIA